MTIPSAPVLTWASPGSKSAPDFKLWLPSSVGDGTDAAVGDVGHIRYSTDNWATAHDYMLYTLTALDLPGRTVTVPGITSLVNAEYLFDARLERAGQGSSAWCDDINVAISAASATVTFLTNTDPNVSGSSTSLPVTIPTGGGLLVVLAYGSDGAASGYSATVAGSSMNIGVQSNAGSYGAAIFSAQVTAGVKTVVVNWGTANSTPIWFAYIAQGTIGSYSAKHSGAGSGNCTILTQAGDLLFAVNRKNSGPDFSGSTTAPDLTNIDQYFGSWGSAAWDGVPANATFNVDTAGSGTTVVAATFA